jgi:hypothetical protein
MFDSMDIVGIDKQPKQAPEDIARHVTDRHLNPRVLI